MERDQDETDDLEEIMDGDEYEEPDDDEREWRAAQLFGTHLYAIDDAVAYEEIESFPIDADRCEVLDRLGSKVPDEEQAKRAEVDRAAEAFVDRHALAEWDSSSTYLVIAIGHGEHFSLYRWTPDEIDEAIQRSRTGGSA